MPTVSAPIRHAARNCVVPLAEQSHAVRWSRLLVSVAVVAVVLTFLPGRSSIAPLIESDYCYLLIAADRLYNGLGLTSLQPVAPHQPWEWKYDWGFLTQWPAGYPILIAGLRTLFRCTCVEACRIVSILGSAAALAGWFTFIRRCVPSGVTGPLLALVAGTSCLSVGLLVNPSTDLILIATLPFVLLLICGGLRNNASPQHQRLPITLAGMLVGGLFWFRYASLFVPAAVAVVLLVEYVRKRIALSTLAVFAVSAALPIGALIAINSLLGSANATSQQFNLGANVGFDLSLASIGRAWWMYTDLGYYSHKTVVHWFFAILPLAMPLLFLFQSTRRPLLRLLEVTEIRLALGLIAALLGMIVCAAGFFGSKFDYIGLERYYLPGRPLIFLILAAPLMLVPRRVVRAALCCALLCFGSWTLFQEWSPTYGRWLEAHRTRTPWGAWSRTFEPNSEKLYQWLSEHNQEQELLVISNFHEYLALETGIATLPIPASPESLATIQEKAARLRGVRSPLPIFVLNPANLWRDYWIAPPERIVREFGLRPLPNAPAELRPYLYVPALPGAGQTDQLTWISWN